MMTIEIISTGDEVLCGFTVDENGAYIARTLTERGFQVRRQGSVGDNLADLATLFKEADGRSSAVIVTGGLGPTEDDRTVEAAASAFGVEVGFDEAAERSVTSFFAKRNRPVPESNRKQMLLPKGAVCLVNDVGTAPGFSFDTGKSVFFFLQGVPSEMRHMMDVHVIPSLESLKGDNPQIFRVRTLSLFGLPEAEVDRQLAVFQTAFPDLQLGFQAIFPVINIKIYARSNDALKIQQRLDQAQDWVMERLGDMIFSSQNRPMAEEVGLLLLKHNKTLAIAESCTGGLIGHMVTNVAGSSGYFLFSGVTYANEAKIRILGVDEQVLKQHGAVSDQTVCAMAQGARKCSGAHIGLAISGIAGPGGGSAEKPVGTVFIGISTDKGTRSVSLRLNIGDRKKNKILFAYAALEMLRRELL